MQINAVDIIFDDGVRPDDGKQFFCQFLSSRVTHGLIKGDRCGEQFVSAVTAKTDSRRGEERCAAALDSKLFDEASELGFDRGLVVLNGLALLQVFGPFNPVEHFIALPCAARRCPKSQDGSQCDGSPPTP